MSFLHRVQHLPVLGIGPSTEHGAGDAPGALDLLALRREYPQYAGFLELGLETAKGLDRHALSWLQTGAPTTYHFLDVNLDEPEDLDADWLDEVRRLCALVRPAWLCGDAGLWHFGPRDRGHMLLLPPVLTDESATAMARGIVALRKATGLEVLPENPPGAVFVGDLHLMDFFARVCERADTGMLLDVAHLAIYQRMTGHQPLDGLDGFPLDRIVEAHVAGGIERDTAGLAWVEDDHTPAILPDTWQILEAIAPRTHNLRAVVFECERNRLEDCIPVFDRIAQVVASTPAGGGTVRSDSVEAPRPPVLPEVRSTQPLQRVVVRMLHDPPYADRVLEGAPVPELDAADRALLQGLDRRAFRTDPHRRGRLLTAFLDEFPVASAFASDGGRDVAGLDAFFSSPRFHAAIQQRRYLALAYGEWLVDQVGADAALELAVARSRRDTVRAPGDARLQRAPGLVPLALPVGSTARWSTLRERLGSDPVGTLVRSQVRTRDLPATGADLEYLLVEPDSTGGVGLSGSSDGLHGLLVAAGEPVERAVLVALARQEGAGDEAEEIVDGLVEEGLLVRVA